MLCADITDFVPSEIHYYQPLYDKDVHDKMSKIQLEIKVTVFFVSASLIHRAPASPISLR